MLVLPGAAGLRCAECKTFNICMFFLQPSWTMTFAFPSTSEPLCGCRWARLLHVTVSNIQLHLHPCWLQGETEKSLTSPCWDKGQACTSLQHLPQSQNPQIHPLEDFSALILTGSAEHK